MVGYNDEFAQAGEDGGSYIEAVGLQLIVFRHLALAFPKK